MLGCPLRAHGAVGETLVRGWSELHQDAPQASVRIWLYRLATGICLEAIEPGDQFRGPHPFDGVRDRNEPPR
jgi:RNA polymerase sigma-70 factor (ECF subfamily)